MCARAVIETCLYSWWKGVKVDKVERKQHIKLHYTGKEEEITTSVVSIRVTVHVQCNHTTKGMNVTTKLCTAQVFQASTSAFIFRFLY